MIQLTVDRLSPLMDIKRHLYRHRSDQVSLIQDHLPHLPKENIIIEPFGMNTAPCIALMCGISKDRLCQRYAYDSPCPLITIFKRTKRHLKKPCALPPKKRN